MYNKGVDKGRAVAIPTTRKERIYSMRRLFGDEVIIKAYTRAKAYGQERQSYRFIVQDYELENKWRIMQDVLDQIPAGEELISIEYADDEHINYGEYIYSEEDDFEDEEVTDFSDLTDYQEFCEAMNIFLDEFGEGEIL